MSFSPAARRDVPLLIGISGPSGSGKTYSALRLAKGIAGERPIAFVDTERGRALHYADEFEFLHSELDAPFTPARYREKLTEAAALDPAVIVVDSFTHEWAGEGGVLDMQQAEYERLGAREAVKFSSWIKPKAEHKALVNDVLLRLSCHLIVCLRAEEKVEMVKNAQGKLEVVPKKTLAGHVGWIPVCGKDLPYELTISLVVTPDRPGVPVAIKLQEQHKPLVPLDRPLDESVGAALAAWARGSSSGAAAGRPPAGEPAPDAPEPSSSPRGSDGPAPDGGSGLKPTKRQLDKLNVLVGTLREAGAIETAHLWAALAKARNVEVDVMIRLLDGRDDAGELHWSPLRDDLRRGEASDLIDRLERLEKNVGAAA